jgi:chaperonin GroEL (HSP60 family)
VRRRADGVPNREQLAVDAFADALESIPRVLAENAGADPLDALVGLRNRHADGQRWAGIDESGEICDTFETNVLESATMKTQILNSAAEAANLVLRIDGMLTVGDLSGDD